MAHSYHHAVSSAKRYGGEPEDYLAIHSWFDESKAFMADPRHRAMRHHAEGIFMAEAVFGVTVTNSAGKQIPTRLIGEQHVMEDMGWIPSVNDWLSNMTVQPWMTAPRERRARVLLDDGASGSEDVGAAVNSRLDAIAEEFNKMKQQVQ